MKIRLSLLLMILLAACNAGGGGSGDEVKTRAIPGLVPGDVYGGIDTSGVTLAEGWQGDIYRRYLVMRRANIDYDIVIRGLDEHSVETVWATARCDSLLNDVLGTQQFFHAVAASPFEGSDPVRIERWITDHFDSTEAAVAIGPVRYRLYAPGRYYRKLTMERTGENNR